MFEDQTPQSPQTLTPKRPAPPQPPIASIAQKPPDNLPIGGGLEELPEDIFADADTIKIASQASFPDIQNIQKIPGDINQLSSEPRSSLPLETLPPQIPHHSAVSRKVLIFMLSALLTAFLLIAFYLVYRIIKAKDNALVYNQPIPNNNQIPRLLSPEGEADGGQANPNNQTIEEESKEEPEPLVEPEPTPQPEPEPISQPEPEPIIEPEPQPEPPPPVDSDGDGLTDLLELEIGSNPQVKDTDLDGLDDYSEVKVYNSNPVKRDTDGDGYDDGTEVENGYSPIGAGKLN